MDIPMITDGAATQALMVSMALAGAVAAASAGAADDRGVETPPATPDASSMCALPDPSDQF